MCKSSAICWSGTWTSAAGRPSKTNCCATIDTLRRITAIRSSTQAFLKGGQESSMNSPNISTAPRRSSRSPRAGGGGCSPSEQFWPILLADYDVDGYGLEPSHEYTSFPHLRAQPEPGGRPVEKTVAGFMGDDTHMSEPGRRRTRSPQGLGRSGCNPWSDLVIPSW